MKKRENQDKILYKLYLIFGTVSSFSGIFLVIFSLIEKSSTLFIIISTVYFTTVVFFVLIFSIRWNSIFHPKFLSSITQAGIKGVYSNKKYPLEVIIDEINERIKEENLENLKILAYYGYKLLQPMEKVIIDSMNAGAKVKVIVAESNSDFVRVVNKLESEAGDKSIEEKEKESTEEQKKAFEIIDHLEQIAKLTGKDFQWKTSTTQIRYALIAINDRWAWWTPYHPGIKVPETTSFVLEDNGNASIVKLCVNHFKTLWRTLPNRDGTKSEEYDI